MKSHQRNRFHLAVILQFPRYLALFHQALLSSSRIVEAESLPSLKFINREYLAPRTRTELSGRKKKLFKVFISNLKRSSSYFFIKCSRIVSISFICFAAIASILADSPSTFVANCVITLICSSSLGFIAIMHWT